MLITTLLAFLKIFNLTKYLRKCKFPESAAKWFQNQYKSNTTSSTTRKANEHWKINSNHNLKLSSSNSSKKSNFSNWESTHIFTSLESMEFLKTTWFSFWSKNGTSLSSMSPFWRPEKALTFKSKNLVYFRVICDFRDCFWQIDESNKKLDYLLRKLRDKIKP